MRRDGTAAAGPSAVAATRREAIAAGEDVLARGGNAVDAAVAVSFVMGVVEPYNNGIGGVGEIVYRTPEGECCVIDCAARAPRGAYAGMYQVVGAASGLYGWPRVDGDRNSVGPLAACAPRLVSGLALAHREFGRLPWADLLAPAIEVAETGVEIDYMTAAVAAHEMPTLAKDPLGRRMYYAAGGPVPPPIDEPPARIPNRELADGLRLIASDGDEAMRRGPLASAVLAASQLDNAAFTQADLDDARAELLRDVAPLLDFRGWKIYGSPRPSGGVTAAQILGILGRLYDEGNLTRETRYELIALSSAVAFDDRLGRLSGSTGPDECAALLSSKHLDRCADEVRRRARTVAPVDAGRARNHRATSTTHFSVVDGEGGAVSLTQTLLAFFGSHVGVPEYGFYLNNGMMWFDPRPGQANSVRAGRRALSAVSPVIAVGPGGDRLVTVGAHGARRIITAVAQVIDNIVEHDMHPQEAVDRPRVHAEVSHATVDHRLGTDLVATLRRRGLNAATGHYGPTSLTSARACAIRLDRPGGTVSTGIDGRSLASWRFGEQWSLS